MMYSLFISLFTIGFYIGLSASAVIEDQDNLVFKYIDIFDKYTLLSFAPRRTRITRNVEEIGNKVHVWVADSPPFTCDLTTMKKLVEGMDRMKTCMDKKQILVTPKAEYMENFQNCTTEGKGPLSRCLPPNLQYFSEISFALAISVQKLTYDYSKEISISGGLTSCLTKLKSEESERGYKECIKEAKGTNSYSWPESKKLYCQKFIKLSECYVKQINNTCTLNSDTEKFSNNFMKTIKEPCLQEL